ncbi:MAG TPA: hypothetical protein DCE42_24120, partial [Myxococcales bacterium]|nr:hypothetical protein [Myxococcales bacterium]
MDQDKAGSALCLVSFLLREGRHIIETKTELFFEKSTITLISKGKDSHHLKALLGKRVRCKQVLPRRN